VGSHRWYRVVIVYLPCTQSAGSKVALIRPRPASLACMGRQLYARSVCKKRHYINRNIIRKAAWFSRWPLRMRKSLQADHGACGKFSLHYYHSRPAIVLLTRPFNHSYPRLGRIGLWPTHGMQTRGGAVSWILDLAARPNLQYGMKMCTLVISSQAACRSQLASLLKPLPALTFTEKPTEPQSRLSRSTQYLVCLSSSPSLFALLFCL